MVPHTKQEEKDDGEDAHNEVHAETHNSSDKEDNIEGWGVQAVRARTHAAHVPPLFEVDAQKPSTTADPKKTASEQLVWQGVCETPGVLHEEARYVVHSQHFAATGSTRTAAVTASAVAVEKNERIVVKLEK